MSVSPRLIRHGSFVTDPITHEVIGYVDNLGREQLGLTAAQAAALREAASGYLAGVVYNGSGLVESYTRAGADFTVDHATPGQITVRNSSGVSRIVTLDGSGRVTAISPPTGI